MPLTKGPSVIAFNNRNDSREDEVERLKVLLDRKKFEILIPEIKSVTAETTAEAENANGAGLNDEQKAGLKTSNDQ